MYIIYMYILSFRMVLALPFLPHEHIPDAAKGLKRKATTDMPKQLMDYVLNTWVESSIWPPENWSIYGMAIRTNNDCEGLYVS